MDLIIRNAAVDGELLDIGVKDGIIVAMEPTLEGTAMEEMDAKGRVTIPGFVDAHLHLDKCLLNERVPYVDVSGPEKGALTRGLKEHFTVEDIMNRAERVIRNGIKAGNLHIRTNVDVDPLVGTKGVEALLALKEKYADLVSIQVTAFSQEGFRNYPDSEGLLEEALKMGADLVGGHTIVDGPEGATHIDKVLLLAEKYGVSADFHVDESGNPDHYLLPHLVTRMQEMGLAGRVNAIHCCTLSALSEDQRTEAYQGMKAAGIRVTVAPTAISTRNLAPVKELLSEGFLVALGSDNVRDFFNPLGSGDVRQVALLLSYIHRFFGEEETDKIFDMVTKDGAKLLDVEDYGLRVGGTADITVLGETSKKEALANQGEVFLLLRKGRVVIVR